MSQIVWTDLLDWSLLNWTGRSLACTVLSEGREPVFLVCSPLFIRLYGLDLPYWIRLNWSGLSSAGSKLLSGTCPLFCSVFLFLFLACWFDEVDEGNQPFLIVISVRRPSFHILIFPLEG
ncbi:hypothetical protein TNIN_148701 [Trichonephila inaurata madagascariensis]|uniref:Uncharacterized protein n=1 Tax=Trichonephila inaurata madagascariensis TaxID=2747483 RepID=A0A8X6YHH8_9ARAC|nr:hypothetical protein TNIN_148701 [Trichonephila inaurata madagascariensis]